MAATSAWKRAIGLVKDRTSIGLAKIATARVPELDVAIVKATSHDDTAVEEKYVQEVIHLTFMSLGYANACLQSLAKRIGKTRNWIVALKVLLVTHRLLREGNAAFEDDLRMVCRRSLNIANFRDESHSNAWDFSAFVRNYAAYLDARLDCFLFTSAPRGVRSDQHDRSFVYSPTKNSFSHSHSTMNNNYHSNHSMQSPQAAKRKLTVKEMDSETLLDFLPSLQLMLDRVLACRPTGAAKSHRLVQVSLYMIVKESFQVYSDLCEGMGSILNVYFDMNLESCSRAFDAYVRFSRQSDSLTTFFTSLKGMGICRPSEYPPVEKVSQDYLDSLEDFLRDLSRSVHSQHPIYRPGNSNAKRPLGEQNGKDIDPTSFERMYGVKALPAPPAEPPLPAPPAETPLTIAKVENLPDLIDLGDGETASAAKGSDKMALALFSEESKASISNNWATFDTAIVQESSQRGAVQPSPATTNNAGVSGWELALVPSESTSLSNTKPVGNLDRVQLEAMYNQTAPRQNSAIMLSASGGSVPVLARPPTPSLALPAPGSFAGQNPFVAPSQYLQIVNFQEKQRYGLQEQQQWQQIQLVNGVYRPYGLTQFYSGPYAPQATLALPPAYYGMAGYTQGR